MSHNILFGFFLKNELVSFTEGIETNARCNDPTKFDIIFLFLFFFSLMEENKLKICAFRKNSFVCEYQKIKLSAVATEDSMCFKSLINPPCYGFFLTNCHNSFQNTSVVSAGMSDHHKMNRYSYENYIF